jgi:hypothetical protein
MDRHGLTVGDARTRAHRAVEPGAGEKQAREWAERALELRRCLSEVGDLRLSGEAMEGLRSGWEAELADLEARINQAGKQKN